MSPQDESNQNRLREANGDPASPLASLHDQLDALRHELHALADDIRLVAPAIDPTYGLPAVLTVEEAASFLRKNVKTVRDAIAAKTFPARRVGRRVVILRDALLQWLWSNSRVLPSKRGA